jgi:hypothetical protein
MHNAGKKPIERKLEEARVKLFNTQSFNELMKPEFFAKTYDSTFICMTISMILAYFMKSEQCQDSVQKFVNVLIQNVNDNLELEDAEEMGKKLLLNHPFTQRMVKKFIQSFSNASEEFKTKLEEMIEDLVQLLLDNLSTLIETRTVFIYVALIENTSYGLKVGFG